MSWDGIERRTGADRRRNVEKRNGLAVLMAGCSECGRIAPSPAEMHDEGWDIEADDLGLVRITCPAHAAPAAPADPDRLPDYIVGA
jgi:hypothetical protein